MAFIAWLLSVGAQATPDRIYQTMLRVIGLQLGAIALTALVALVASGPLLAFSALLGGMIVIVPNALFAWQLNRVTRAESFPGVFMVGEAVKIFLTVAMLGGVIGMGITFNWPMLVGAMGIALKAPMLGWFFERKAAAQAV